MTFDCWMLVGKSPNSGAPLEVWAGVARGAGGGRSARCGHNRSRDQQSEGGNYRAVFHNVLLFVLRCRTGFEPRSQNESRVPLGQVTVDQQQDAVADLPAVLETFETVELASDVQLLALPTMLVHGEAGVDVRHMVIDIARIRGSRRRRHVRDGGVWAWR